jgi:hypothetical protein
LVALAAAGYLAVRALTKGDADVARSHARDVLAAERSLRIDWESSAQGFVLRSVALVRFFDLVYVWIFWPIVVGTLAVLYRRARGLYVHLRNALFVSGAVGVVVFATFPVAPPRLMPGFTDTVGQLSRQHHVAHPSGFTNAYAAMPSFHVGWTVLAGVCLAMWARRPIMRGLALVPGALMAIAVVVTANHFVLDAVAGTAVSLGALAATHRRSLPRRPLGPVVIVHRGCAHGERGTISGDGVPDGSHVADVARARAW